LAVDVVGMRLDDVVKKLRDLRELRFVCIVKKVDGTIKIIIIRDIVEIEETMLSLVLLQKWFEIWGDLFT
jgi:carboxyl-terminal processing protease